jgi:hypothetical protein
MKQSTIRHFFAPISRGWFALACGRDRTRMRLPVFVSAPFEAALRASEGLAFPSLTMRRMWTAPDQVRFGPAFWADRSIV